MSTQCDRCLTNLNWKFDVRSNQLSTKWSTQGFSQKAVADCYSGIVRGCGVTISPLGVVPLINLCESCWAKQADVWVSGGASVYATIPAKTADDGVYFNNDRPDYADAGKPDVDKIVSTCVHEMSHYWSHDHKGLQAFETGKNVHWDECVTDFIARKTYFGICQGTYKTSYGTMSEFISKAVNAVTSKPVPAFKKTAVAGFPPPFNSVVTPPLKKADMEASLAKKFVTWYLSGDAIPVDGQGIAAFVSSPTGQFFFSTTTDQSLGYGVPTSLQRA